VTRVYLIIAGKVSCRLARNVSFKSYISGSYFGDLEIFNQSQRLFSVLAEEPLTLAVIERDDFFHVMKNYPQDHLRILKKVSLRYLKYRCSLRKIQSFKLINMNNEWWEESEDETEHVNKKISQWIDLIKSKDWSSKRNRNFKGSEQWWLRLTQEKTPRAEVLRLEAFEDEQEEYQGAPRAAVARHSRKNQHVEQPHQRCSQAQTDAHEVRPPADSRRSLPQGTARLGKPDR